MFRDVVAVVTNVVLNCSGYLAQNMITFERRMPLLTLVREKVNKTMACHLLVEELFSGVAPFGRNFCRLG